MPRAQRRRVRPDLIRRQSLVIQRDRHHRLAAEQVDDLHLSLRPGQREIGKTVIVCAGRGVLQHDAFRPGARQDLETAGISRVRQAALALHDDDVGPLLPEGPQHLVLDLAGDEVVHQAVHDQPVARALHPGGLSGAHHHRAASGRAELLRQANGGRSLADARIGPEHRQSDRGHFQDAAGEGMHRFARRSAADVADPRAAFRRHDCELGVVPQEFMESRVDVDPEAEGPADRRTERRRENAAVGGDAHDEKVRASTGEAHRLVQVGHDRYTRGPAVQDLAGVPPSRPAVDDRQHTVSIRVPDQTVRGFALGAAEGPLTQDDRRPLRPLPTHHSRL